MVLGLSEQALAKEEAMSRSMTRGGFPFGRRAFVTLALASIVGICAFLVLASPAAAQPTASGTDVIASMVVTDTTSTTSDNSANQADTTPAAGGKVTTERPVPSATQILYFVLAALLFALLAVIAVLTYNYLIQNRFYTVTENLGQAGKAVRAIPAQAFQAAGEKTRDETLKIDGPGVITVGVQSPEFSATIDNNAAEKATWTVEPANMAIVIPATGAKVRVVAAMAGTFALSATATEPKEGSAKVQVAAIAPQNMATELPFIGGGYGSIVIAIILLAAVIVLGLAAVLSGEAVATLLGGLLGYIFGVGASAATNKPENKPGSSG